jgi:D-alanyl-D-alanine carboxypeptidase
MWAQVHCPPDADPGIVAIMTVAHRRTVRRVGLAGLAALLVAGCGSSGDSGGSTAGTTTTASSSAPSSSAPSSSAPSSSAPSSSVPTLDSTSAAGDPAYVATLKPAIDEVVAELGIVGAVVMVRSPELGDWSTAIGTRTYQGDDPVTVDDHVRIGSNTKTMTATVILQLVQEGLLKLDDPVSTYRPDVPNGENITIAQLLDMRSGLGNYSTDLTLNEQQDSDPGRVYTAEELIAMGLAMPPEFAPGDGWFYSNTNYVLLGAIIEKLTGHPVEEEFATRIFERLGLEGTSMPAPDDATLPDPHPQGYTYGTNVGTIDSNILSPEVQAAAEDGTLAPFDVTGMNPSWAWTAGGAISTAGDLATYVKAMVGGGLLDPALQQQRMDSITPTDPGNPEAADYGYGIGGFGPFYGHSGELPGYNSFMGYDPTTDTTVVTWATNAPAPNGKGPAVELAKAAIAAFAAG